MGDGRLRYPLLAHLLDTAASAMVLWDQWLRPNLRTLIAEALDTDLDHARSLVAFAAGIHDVGKANAVFQTQMRSARPSEWVAGVKAEFVAAGYPSLDLEADWEGERPQFLTSRHEAVGYHALNGWVRQNLNASALDQWCAVTTLGHHGRFRDTGSMLDELLKEMQLASQGQWGVQQDAHREALASALDVTDIPKLTGPRAAAALVLIAGIVQLADHLASEDMFVHQGRRAHRTHPCHGDSKAWLSRRYDILAASLPDTLGVYVSPSDPLAAIGNPTELTALQRDALTVGDGLWIVTAGTGDGKTNAAALRHMTRTDEGMVFALPTRATSDAIMHRVIPWFQGTNNIGGIAHGTSSLHAFYAPPPTEDECTEEDTTGKLRAGEWYERRDRALLNPVLVATCDQVLRGALNQPSSPMRLLALANKHVILDEVHTYDLYQTRLLAELLTWWGATRTRVTMLTATLETWQRNLFTAAYNTNAPQITPEQVRFPDHTLIDATTGHATSPPEQPTPRLKPWDVRLDLVRTPDPTQDHIDWAMKMRAEHPRARIGVVVNTVDAAIKIADELTIAGHDVILLHSRMVAGHRAEVTDRLLHELGGLDEDRPDRGQGEGITVVGTQVVEASLDIDLDLLSTDLAPAPSLVQRDGRKWRFNDKRRTDRIGALADPAHRHLRIVVRTDESGNLHADQLPYFTSQQRRTLSACEATPVLHVPSGVQTFVEAAALSLEEAQRAADAEGASADEFTYLASLMKRASAARRARSDIAALLDEPTLGRLVTLTARPETRDERATRFMELNSETFILIDPTGEHPYALHTTVSALASATDRDTLEGALRASVPAHGKLRDVLSESCVEGWVPKARLLRDFRLVDVSRWGGVEYGPSGLRFSTAR